MYKIFIILLMTVIAHPVRAETLIDCNLTSEKTGKTYGISGSEILLRKGPGKKHDKIVNDKATAIMHSTEYIKLDSSETVNEVCHENGWSRIQVIEPSWLTDNIGWVESKYLRGYELDSGVRKYVDEDFTWDKNTRPYRELIVKGVNKVARENDRCTKIDASSAYLSEKSKAKSDPIFFVTCEDTSGIPFNVFFSKKDILSDQKLSSKPFIDHTKAAELCEEYAKSHAAHPSTVDFSRLMDISFNDSSNGRTSVTSTFTAKNSFNLELKFNIRCILDSSGLIDANINESK